MGKQYNKEIKRSRRLSYLKRRKERDKAAMAMKKSAPKSRKGVSAPKDEPKPESADVETIDAGDEAAPAKKAAAKKKAPAKKAAKTEEEAASAEESGEAAES
ncbi:MAG: hypothetical protein KDM64_08630 [Verrucomicrobiae bacterium]|nr:hypothetical protein [Verrucomicrobiae bacterium]